MTSLGVVPFHHFLSCIIPLARQCDYGHSTRGDSEPHLHSMALSPADDRFSHDSPREGLSKKPPRADTSYAPVLHFVLSVSQLDRYIGHQRPYKNMYFSVLNSHTTHEPATREPKLGRDDWPDGVISAPRRRWDSEPQLGAEGLDLSDS